MEALHEPAARRRRYTRRPASRPATLTPARLTLLRLVAEYQPVTTAQLAKLACLSEKAVRRHTREIFDSDWIAVNPVHRSALADPGQARDESFLWGSAPNIWTLTRAGQRLLEQAGEVGEIRVPPPYGPANSLFLAHTIAVRDAAVWLELSARRYHEHELRRWVAGPAAEIELDNPRPPRVVRPDAWLVYGLGTAVLVGLLELDRGTERGGRRWSQKIAAYDALFASGTLSAVTGYVNARVLVVTLDARRRDRLAAFLKEQAPPALASRIWLTERTTLDNPDLSAPVWRQPEGEALLSLVPATLLTRR